MFRIQWHIYNYQSPYLKVINLYPQNSINKK
jgi:hypothetical protein